MSSVSAKCASQGFLLQCVTDLVPQSEIPDVFLLIIIITWLVLSALSAGFYIHDQTWFNVDCGYSTFQSSLFADFHYCVCLASKLHDYLAAQAIIITKATFILAEILNNCDIGISFFGPLSAKSKQHFLVCSSNVSLNGGTGA